MRLSETKVVQLVEETPPVVVIVDEVSTEEIVLSAKEAVILMAALDYFGPTLWPKQPAV